MAPDEANPMLVLPSQSATHEQCPQVEQKAPWTRGLFVRSRGPTDDGLTTFGPDKRLICLDRSDLYESLGWGNPLTNVLERKARRAAEIGGPFARVRVCDHH